MIEGEMKGFGMSALDESHVLCVQDDYLELVPLKGYRYAMVMLHGIGDSMHGWLPRALVGCSNRAEDSLMYA